MAHRIADHRHQRLEVADVQALLRLCNALHMSGGEPDDRKRTLLDGLRTLIGADRASASVATLAGEGAGSSGASGRRGAGGAIKVVSAVARPPAPDAAGDTCPWHAYHSRRPNPSRAAGRGRIPTGWCMTGSIPPVPLRPKRHRGRGGGRGHFVHSFIPLADGQVIACLTVGRDPGRPRFTSRDRSIVCTLHPEVSWIYRADVMLVSPETRALPHRVRETLRHLLAGKGEKQVAATMGIRYNTIHHYVKTLHRHFGVSSRAELLARWVGR